jgi:hypothetical protein
MTKLTTPDGLEHNITEVDFKAPEEPWIEYKISDGTLIKFRSIIASIGKSDKFDEHGQPIYFINSQNQMRSYSPKELRGEPTKRPQQPMVKTPLDTTNSSYR